MKPGRGWPIAIVSLLSLNMVIVGITTYLATHSKTSVVVPDYYTKAVHWDDTAKQVATNHSLGWTATFSLRATTKNHPGEVSLRLVDGAGSPIRAATVHVEAFHESDATNKLSGVLSMTPEGTYAAAFPIDRPGRWRLHIVVDAVGMRFTAEQSVETGAAASPA